MARIERPAARAAARLAAPPALAALTVTAVSVPAALPWIAVAATGGGVFAAGLVIGWRCGSAVSREERDDLRGMVERWNKADLTSEMDEVRALTPPDGVATVRPDWANLHPDAGRGAV